MCNKILLPKAFQELFTGLEIMAEWTVQCLADPICLALYGITVVLYDPMKVMDLGKNSIYSQVSL